MCTSQTERIGLVAHGKGEDRWTALSSAAVYYDHPVRSTADHAVVIDLRDDKGPPSARVVLELSAGSAAALAGAITRVLDTPLAKQEVAASEGGQG